jgi:Ca2+/Na+ antiporter
MNLIFEFFKFIVFSLGIVIISKYLLVPILRKISTILNLSARARGNIAGFATSVPELLTVCFSASSGLIGTSIYNILSSNTINLIQYTFTVYLNKNQKYLRNKAILTDIILALITVAIPLIAVIFKFTFGMISVVIFVILSFVFYYTNHNMHKLYLGKEDKEIEKEEQTEAENEDRKSNKKGNIILYAIVLLIIVALLYWIGELLSNSLTNLCKTFGLPEIVVGILLGFITSIPELITFTEAQRKEKSKNDEMANKIGVVEATNNLLTSNILNLFVIQSIGIILYSIFG